MTSQPVGSASATPATQTDGGSSSGLSSGASIGLGVGLGVGVMAIIALAYLAFRRHMKKKQRPVQPEIAQSPNFPQTQYYGEAPPHRGDEKPLMGIHTPPPPPQRQQAPVEMANTTVPYNDRDFHTESGGTSETPSRNQHGIAELSSER